MTGERDADESGSEGDLAGTVALIIGASAGIGRETVRVFAREGAETIIAARREDRLNELADEIETKYDMSCLPVPTDVTDESQVAALAKKSLDAFGRLDVVVFSAGIGREQVPVQEMSTDHYRSIMDVNVDGLFFTARETLSALEETSGNFIVVGSAAGQYPVQSQPIYAASKWWARGFALSIAGTMERHGVGVTIVQPSEVRTEIISPDGMARADQHEEGDVIEPNETAEAIRFAAQQAPPTSVTQLDLFRRDMLDFF